MPFYRSLISWILDGCRANLLIYTTRGNSGRNYGSAHKSGALHQRPPPPPQSLQNIGTSREYWSKKTFPVLWTLTSMLITTECHGALIRMRAHELNVVETWYEKETSPSVNYECASKIPCIVPSFASRGLSCLCGAWRLWRWLRGTHWGQGYNRPTGYSAEKAPHATFNFFLTPGGHSQLRSVRFTFRVKILIRNLLSQLCVLLNGG